MNHTDVIRGEEPVGKKPWTTREVAELRRLAPHGAVYVAEVLDRTTRSVRRQAARLRISLRRAGEQRGRFLGQPAHRPLEADRVQMLRTLRADVLAGTVDVARIERRIRLMARGEICPACTKRPQEVASTGLCEPCHLEYLAQGHRDELALQEARRTLDRERQRKHRRKAATRS